MIRPEQITTTEFSPAYLQVSKRIEDVIGGMMTRVYAAHTASKMPAELMADPEWRLVALPLGWTFASRETETLFGTLRQIVGHETDEINDCAARYCLETPQPGGMVIVEELRILSSGLMEARSTMENPYDTTDDTNARRFFVIPDTREACMVALQRIEAARDTMQLDAAALAASIVPPLGP